MAVQLRRLQAQDSDLAALAAQLNAADSEVSIKNFSEESLRKFLEDSDRIYLVAYIEDELAGAVHGFIHLHPTGVKYFYVDEVDTIKAFRQKGVATALMNEAFRIAKEYGCDEVWLGTEDDNVAANALYKSLKPSEVEHGPIYSYKIEK